MFELIDLTTLKVQSINPRKERNGDDLVQAVDIGLRWETSNESLSHFDGWLLFSLYKNTAAEAGQKTLQDVPEGFPNLRIPLLKMPLKWDWEGAGYTLRIDHGLGGDRDLELMACGVKKVSFDCREGGTTFIDFTVQCSTNITEKVIGKLCGLEGTEILASLLAPDEREAIDGTTGHPAFADEAQGDLMGATDAFVEASLHH